MEDPRNCVSLVAGWFFMGLYVFLLYCAFSMLVTGNSSGVVLCIVIGLVFKEDIIWLFEETANIFGAGD